MKKKPLLQRRDPAAEDRVFRAPRTLPLIGESPEYVLPGPQDPVALLHDRDIFVVQDKKGDYYIPVYEELCRWYPVTAEQSCLRLGMTGGKAFHLLDADDISGAALPELTPDLDDPVADFVHLRGLLPALPADTVAALTAGVQILDWVRQNRFCGHCGHKTEKSGTDRAMVCPACRSRFYPRLSPAVITAIIKDNKILLAHNRRFSAPIFSLIAGFVDPGETLEETVAREALEEVGITVGNIRYLGSQCWPFPNSLMLGFVAEWQDGEIRVDEEEIDAAEWFDFNKLPELPLGASISRRIIDYLLGLASQS